MTSGIDGSSPAPPAVEAASPRMSGMQRIFGALFNPGETFAEIATRPDIVAPLVLIMVLSLASSIITVPRIDFDSVVREQLSQTNPDMSPEDMDRAARFGGSMGKVIAYASPLFSLLFVVVIAAVLLMEFRLFGGEGTFKQAMSVTLYSWVPLMIAALISTIILLGRGKVSASELQTLVMSNPGFLVDQKENPIGFALLSSIDLFTIWSVILLTIGFSYVSRMSRVKSAAVVISLWFLQILVKVGLAAMSASRMKG